MKRQPTEGSPQVSHCKPIYRNYSSEVLTNAPESPVTVFAISLHIDFNERNIRLGDDDSAGVGYDKLFANDKEHDPHLSGCSVARPVSHLVA